MWQLELVQNSGKKRKEQFFDQYVVTMIDEEKLNCPHTGGTKGHIYTLPFEI